MCDTWWTGAGRLTVSDLEQPDSDEPIELKTVNGELVRP